MLHVGIADEHRGGMRVAEADFGIVLEATVPLKVMGEGIFPVIYRGINASSQ